MINVTIRVPTGHSINVPRGTRDAVIEFLRERGAKRGNYSLITTGAAKGTHRRKEAGVSVLSGNAAVKIVVQPGSNNTSREYAFTAHPYDNDDELRKLLLSPPKVSTTEGSNHITAVELLSNQDAQMCIAEALGDSLSEQDVAVAIQLAAEGLGRSINAQELAVASKIVMTQLTKAKSADQAAHEPIEAESSSDGRDPAWVEFVGKRGTIRGEGYARKFAKRFGNSVFTSSDIFNCYAEYVKEEFGCKTPDATDHQRRFVAQLHTKARLVYRISAKRPGYRVATSLLKSVNVPPDTHGLAPVATDVVAPRKDAEETQACDLSRHTQLERILSKLQALAEGLRAEIDTEYAAIAAESEALERRRQAQSERRDLYTQHCALIKGTMAAMDAIKEAEK